MADKKKYYYIKLKDNFFDQTKIKILEAMPEGYVFENVYFKMILRSLPMEGTLRISEAIPYTPEALAAVTGHEVSTVRGAIEALSKLGLIELIENDTIFINDIQNFIGQSSSDADRKRLERSRKKTTVDICPPEIRDKRLENRDYSIENKDKSIENKEKKNKEKEERLNRLLEEYHRICTSLPSVRKVEGTRKAHTFKRMDSFSDDDFLACFEKAEASDFLSGRKENWRASWDWFMTNDENILKVLEGNYDNPKKKSGGFGGYEDAIDGKFQWVD